jgi:hypothetical protein
MYATCTCNEVVWDEFEQKYEYPGEACDFCKDEDAAEEAGLAESLGVSVADLQRWLGGATAAYVRPAFSGRRARRARAERARRKAA